MKLVTNLHDIHFSNILQFHTNQKRNPYYFIKRQNYFKKNSKKIPNYWSKNKKSKKMGKNKIFIKKKEKQIYQVNKL